MSASAAPEAGGDEPASAAAHGLPSTRKLQTRAGLLEYTLSGDGPPGIVLMNGAGMTLDGWQALYPGIERLGAVFAWNRFGVEGSAQPRLEQNGAVVIASLRELLAYAGLQPPYVLVAHSLGGLHANLFARLYPAEVAAVLFLEATHPRDHEVLRPDEAQLGRALSKVLSAPEEDFRANLHAELEAAAETVQEIESAGPFPPVPLRVISGGTEPPKWLLSPDAAEAKRKHQQQLAGLSPLGKQVIAERSGHFPQRSEPDLVLDVLRRLIECVARCAPLAGG
jgi:pimeloyl-ACP methyl ester carboxylesterase